MSARDIIAEESHGELINLLRWFSKSGPTPTLIGGWAVWMYNSYLGSVDIDIVGPSLAGSFDNVIERYEQIHQYERVERDPIGLEYAYRKPIFRGSELMGFIEIDACSFEADSGRFHENAEKVLPYRLCADPKLTRRITLDGDALCFIPCKSLLFLYKLKAERDRSFDLKTRGAVMGAERRNWLEAKLSKDQSDLIALLEPEPRNRVVVDEVEWEMVKRIVEKQGIEFVYDSISSLPSRAEAIARYSTYRKTSPREIEEWVEPLVSK